MNSFMTTGNEREVVLSAVRLSSSSWIRKRELAAGKMAATRWMCPLHLCQQTRLLVQGSEREELQIDSVQKTHHTETHTHTPYLWTAVTTGNRGGDNRVGASWWTQLRPWVCAWNASAKETEYGRLFRTGDWADKKIPTNAKDVLFQRIKNQALDQLTLSCISYSTLDFLWGNLKKESTKQNGQRFIKKIYKRQHKQTCEHIKCIKNFSSFQKLVLDEKSKMNQKR